MLLLFHKFEHISKQEIAYHQLRYLLIVFTIRTVVNSTPLFNHTFQDSHRHNDRQTIHVMNTKKYAPLLQSPSPQHADWHGGAIGDAFASLVIPTTVGEHQLRSRI